MENNIKLADIQVGDTFTVGKHTFIVLEQVEGRTFALTKNAICNMTFGKSNNFAQSEVRTKLEDFAWEIMESVGEGNLIEHTVDLTSDDGLDDYGEVDTKASLLTADMYRKYVRVIDRYKLDTWWWLATAFSTTTHDDDYWVKCVSPHGFIRNGNYDYNDFGVRPFCIFVSDIFVS